MNRNKQAEWPCLGKAMPYQGKYYADEIRTGWPNNRLISGPSTFNNLVGTFYTLKASARSNHYTPEFNCVERSFKEDPRAGI